MRGEVNDNGIISEQENCFEKGCPTANNDQLIINIYLYGTTMFQMISETSIQEE